MENDAASPNSITQKIRSGEFFRESLSAYHINYHDPITDRYFYIGLTSVSLLILLLSLAAIVMIHPLSKDVPFIFTSQDLVEEYPRIRALGSREDDPNFLLKRFYAENYLRLREEYDAQTLERSARGVQSQSTKEVFTQYQQFMDPRSPGSPIQKFQRRAVRKVEPLGVSLTAGEGDQEIMTVEYKEQVMEGADISSQRRRAIITFRFDDIEVDQETGKASSLHFEVVDYKTEALNS